MSTLTTTDQTSNPDVPEINETSWFTTAVGAFIRNNAGIVTALAGGVTTVTVADIDDPSTELASLSGANEGGLLAVFQLVGSGDNVMTFYQWDTSTSGAVNVPFTVNGTGGRWLASGGRYINGATQASTPLAYTPAEVDDWTPDPTTIDEALDQLAARGDRLTWGDSSVASTTTTKFLTPTFNSGNAGTVEFGHVVIRDGVFRGFGVFHNAGAGNGNDIVYTLRVNSVDTALTVSVASDSTDLVSILLSVAVVAGDVITVGVTKAASVGSSPSNIQAVAAFR